MVKALPNTSFLPVPKSAPAGHTTAAAHLLWQVFPQYPCLEYKDNSGQSCPVRYTWTASFGCGLMFWQKWFNLTPQFVAYQFPGHLLHPHWYFTAYSSICQVLLGALSWNASFLTLSDAGIVAAIFLVGVIGRWIMKFCIYRFQSVASYEATADARLAVEDHLKQAPMGFFNSETIGNTVTTLTDDMHYIEQNAANILEKTINGCINVFVMTLGVFVFDWRLGLIFLMGAILSLAIISSMQKAGISVAR